ncbi:MAG: HAD family hydrolase [Deltaproteobacteria bacterium]|nr:HAD family hydrolase [Deltaproteobacteria bacterium]
MFEAILFDFDGTLVDFVASDIQSLKCLHTHINSSVCFDDFLNTSVDEIMSFHRLVAEHKIDPLVMHKFRLQNTFSRHNLAWDDEYVDFYQDKLLKTCTPFNGVEKLLSGVKQKVKTGLITNAYDGQEQGERIRSSGLEIYFDLIVIAGDIGLYKPDISIFLYALNRLNVAPDRALYVGDSIKYDIVGAKAAGMKTTLFSKQSNRDCNVADYNVKGIDELQALFDRVIV